MTIKKGTSIIATDGSTYWGSIEGPLTDQEDLNNALSLKAPTLNPSFTGIPTAPTAAEGTNTNQIATTAFVKTAVSDIDALPDQTDMEGKYLATDGVNAYWKSPAGLPLLSHIWADHILNDASFLRADTFSWQNGSVYKSAYEHLVADVQGINLTTETIGSYTITYYRAADGHKIALLNMEETVQNIYQETGVAWFYVLDTSIGRFKLPRTKYGFVGYRDNVGDYVQAGLPNIEGSTEGIVCYTESFSGALSGGETLSTANWVAGGAERKKIYLDASESNSIYGNSTTVQPPASEMYLYFFVGNSIRNETTVDVAEITEALNGKLDQDLSNASSTFRQSVITYGIPDYTAGISLSTNTQYTADKCYFIIQQAIGSVQSSITINDIEFVNNSNNATATIGWYVKTGDTYKTGTSGSYTKYPLIGD